MAKRTLQAGSQRPAGSAVKMPEFKQSAMPAKPVGTVKKASSFFVKKGK